MTLVLAKIFLLWIWLFKPTGAFLRSDLDVGGGGTRRAVHCRDELEYLNGRICCLNCPAGEPCCPQRPEVGV